MALLLSPRATRRSTASSRRESGVTTSVVAPLCEVALAALSGSLRSRSVPTQPRRRPLMSCAGATWQRTRRCAPDGASRRKWVSALRPLLMAALHSAITRSRSSGCRALLQPSPSACSAGIPASAHQRGLTKVQEPASSVWKMPKGESSIST